MALLVHDSPDCIYNYQLTRASSTILGVQPQTIGSSAGPSRGGRGATALAVAGGVAVALAALALLSRC